MNEIQIFENAEFGSVRTLSLNEEPWFVGRDIATILGYAKPENALSNHVDTEDKTTTLIQGNGSNYKSKNTIINESGLYSLIMSSKLPTAKKFKRWVTSEVLPTIRKTGGYVNNEDLFINTYLPFADENTKSLFRSTLTTINQLNSKLEQNKPLVEFAEHIQDSKDCISMNDMSKIASKQGIQIRRNKLFKFLRESKVLQPSNIPYQVYMDKEWFKVVETSYDDSGVSHIVLVTLVTTKGQSGILRLLKKSYCA